MLPPVVIGYLLLVAMGRNGFIGKYLYQWFGLSFGFSWKGAVLSSAVVAFPLVVRAIRLSLENIDIKLEQAAQTLGASAWRVFFYNNLAAFFTWGFSWTRSWFCSIIRGIWRDHYVCIEHCRRNSNDSPCDVFFYSNTRCRRTNRSLMFICYHSFIDFFAIVRVVEQADAEKN